MNAVYVSRYYYDSAQPRNAFSCGHFSWTSVLRPDPDAPLFCKVRHGPHAYACTLELGHAPASIGARASGDDLNSSSSSRGVTHALSWSEGGGGSGQQLVGRVTLEGDDQGLAAGQFAAFYQDVSGQRVCLGSAVILGSE